MNNQVQFPALLYKAFSRREHAEAFCEGRIRFSSLQSFRESKDWARADSTEGVGLIKRDAKSSQAEPPGARVDSQAGVQKVCIEAPERECFICCFSLPGEDVLKLLPERFGSFYVKVSSPASLYHDIEVAIRRDRSLRQTPELEAGAVRYDKGHYVGKLKDPDQIRALPWLQKPVYYAEENEYRLHFRCKHEQALESKRDHIIRVGKQLEYCEMFETHR